MFTTFPRIDSKQTEDIQQRLVDVGFLPPSQKDGEMGIITVSAMQRFAEALDIEQDFDTLKSWLQKSDQEIKERISLVQSEGTSLPGQDHGQFKEAYWVRPESADEIEFGATSLFVEERLSTLGFLAEDQVNGIIGSSTLKAYAEFDKALGLSGDPDERIAWLDASTDEVSRRKHLASRVKESPAYSEELHHMQVRLLKEGLIEKKFVEGLDGPHTEKALSEFALLHGVDKGSKEMRALLLSGSKDQGTIASTSTEPADTNSQSENLQSQASTQPEKTQETQTTPRLSSQEVGRVEFRDFDKYEPFPVEGDPFDAVVEGREFTLQKVRGLSGVYTTVGKEAGESLFYIGQFTDDQPPHSVGIINEQEFVDKARHLPQREGSFVIPSPRNSIPEVLESGDLEKMGLELVGVVGTGYIGLSNDPVERRQGYTWTREQGVIGESENWSDLEQGYYVKNGKAHYLKEGTTKADIEALQKDPDVDAVTILGFGINFDEERDPNAYSKYRASYLVFDGEGEYIGTSLTGLSLNETQRMEQIREYYPDAENVVRLDGDFYGKVYTTDPATRTDASRAILRAENAQLLVRPRTEGASQREQSLLNATPTDKELKEFVQGDLEKDAVTATDQELIERKGNAGRAFSTLRKVPFLGDKLIDFVVDRELKRREKS